MLDGIKINVGNEEFIVPPLNFKLLKLLKKDIEGLKSVGENLTDDQYESLINIIHAAVQRNYPHKSRENIEEIVDLNNVKIIIKAIMGGSGFIEKKTVATKQN